MSTQLSSSQKKTLENFHKFLDDDDNLFIISGFAGSGKSFLVKYLATVAEKIRKLRISLASTESAKKAEDFRIFFTATTHKAKNVLADLTKANAHTIYSLLDLKVVNDYKNGSTKLKSKENPVFFPHGALVFVDEASMIDADLMKHIGTCVDFNKRNETSVKFVFIGDKFQLPPTRQKVLNLFDHPEVNHLTEIQRQLQGSSIIAASQAYRAVLDSDLPPTTWPDSKAFSGAVQWLSRARFESEILKHFRNYPDPDKCKILGWTNECVRDYNSFVRDLHGLPKDHFKEDEWVVNNQHFQSGSLTIGNDQVVKINEIYPDKFKVHGYVLEGYRVRVQKDPRYAFMPKDFKLVKEIMKKLAKAQNWSMYFVLKEGLLDLRPVHAQTCHKAQGSTYETVFVDLDDIGKNNKWQEVARLVYVAISRASKQVYLTGELPIRNWK